MRCILCRGSQIDFIGRPQISPIAVKLIKADYAVVKCKTCEFYFVFPEIPFSISEWEMLYADEYFGEMTKWFALKREKDRIKNLYSLEKYSDIQIKNFLDIGCGEGNMLLNALGRGWNAYGIDIADNRILAARNKAISFCKCDIFQSKFPDNYFECIYMDSVLEHVLNPIAYLAEIKRILKTGGVLYVSVPDENCLLNAVKKIVYSLTGKQGISAHIKPFQNPFHIIGFTKQSLHSALEMSGFKILELRNFAGEYQWRKHNVFTRQFFLEISLLPIHLIAIPLGKRLYLEAIAVK